MPFRLFRHDEKSLSWEDIESLIVSGDLDGGTMVRRDGEPGFMPLRERLEFDHLFTAEAIAARQSAANRRSERTVLDTQRVKGVPYVGGHPELPAGTVLVDVAIDSRYFFLLDGEQRLVAIPRSKVTHVGAHREKDAFVVAVESDENGSTITTRFRLSLEDGEARADELVTFFRSRSLAV